MAYYFTTRMEEIRNILHKSQWTKGVTIFILLLSLTGIFAQEDPSNESIAVSLIDNLKKIDPRVRPGIYGPPTVVHIDFFVQSFGSLNEVEMEFTADVDFRETWFDPRLQFNSTLDVPIYIPPQHVTDFWLPDVYFPNSKGGSQHDITIPNRSIRIYRDGTIRYFTRVGVTISCTMYLASFPFDNQECSFKISTYSYDKKEIILSWKDNASIEIKWEELNLPQFYLSKPLQSDDCVENYKTGNYSCLMATFYFHRKIGFFVLQTYIPSMLIVMLSWVAFWINKNSEPARITLGVTTVLTMTTQLTSSRSNTMRVSYPKAIDVWYSACMVFVFGALLEYAFVNISVRTERKRVHDKDVQQVLLYCADLDVENQQMNHRGRSRKKSIDKDEPVWSRRLNNWKSSLTSKGIDHLSRRLFPAMFLLFNMIYWSVYLCFYYLGM